ncbi:hypothetical protein L7F22_031538 [Adiantum nelumboides]|nr:hypothetical protein [Adiantum nelumboides]
MTQSQAMALLAATAGLSICARSELAKAMTSLHMKLILCVSKDKSRIYIGLLAEPILAKGAASALRDNKVQEGALKNLLAACKEGYVTPGPQGEFVAKFILVAAMWDKEIEWQLRLILAEVYLEKLLVSGQYDRRNFDQRAEDTLPDVGVDMIILVWTSKCRTCIVVLIMNLKQSSWLEKVSTDKVRWEFTKVEVQLGLICITIIMSLREPVTKDSDDWLPCVSPQEDAATYMDPYINLTCYGIDRNYSYLTENMKELLKAVLITVPDEFAGATDEEKEWTKGLLP